MAEKGVTHAAQNLADAAAVGAVAAVWAQWLPVIAAGLSVVWLLIRIWESDTVRGITGRRRPAPRDFRMPPGAD